MCGPLKDSGGVAMHTKNISEALSNSGAQIIFNNTSLNNSTNIAIIDYFIIMWRRTVGLILNSMKLRNEYDIIHIQSSGGIFSFIAALSGSFISTILHKNLVITFHYRPSEKFAINHYRLISFVLNQCDIFFIVSNKQKQIFEKHFPIFSSKLHVIPNGFDANKFKMLDQKLCRSELKLPLDKKILLTVGNLVPEKGQCYLIEAIKEIVKYRTDIICLIIGHSKLKEAFEIMINNLQLSDYVILIGKKPHEEIPLWINGCDLFVLPSLIEGNPTVMFECMGCGKPFVGTKVGGIPEIITSEDYGLLCEPADPEGLAKNLLIALDKEWNVKRIEEYSVQFTWDVISIEILNVYSKIDYIKLMSNKFVRSHED